MEKKLNKRKAENSIKYIITRGKEKNSDYLNNCPRLKITRNHFRETFSSTKFEKPIGHTTVTNDHR